MRLTWNHFLFYVIPFCTFVYLITIEQPDLSTLDLWVCIGLVALWPLAYWWFEFEPGYRKRHPLPASTETESEREEKAFIRDLKDFQRRAELSGFRRFINNPVVFLLSYVLCAFLLLRLLTWLL